MDQVFFRRFDASSLPLSYIVFPFAILFEEEKSYVRLKKSARV